MGNFITNNATKSLKRRLVELIEKSEELKFLVGFFYFSGIEELHNGIKSKPEAVMKVLVGLNVDHSNFGLIEFAEDGKTSDQEKIDKFCESVKKSLDTDDFDVREFYEQVRFFIDLIREDRLIIRKTFKPNHAKLYIFKLDQSQVGRRSLFVTGSSNLTRSGLSMQDEFNVEIGDYGFEDAESYFDDLWDRAVKITEYEDTKKKLIKIVEQETLVKEVTPFEAFCLVLKTYLDSFKQKDIGGLLIEILEKNGYKEYRYQLDAVEQALAIIESNNGVIVADVVGLGKSVVACAIAKHLKKRGVIICPPGLIGDASRDSGWKKYVEDFRLYEWEVRSLGDLENTLEFVKKAKDIEVVIVDEAHRFRNQDTKGYELLKNICREKQVILLTATPFNNRPGDILSLLKLFINPKKSSITLDGNLVNQFRVFKEIFDRIAYIKKHCNSPDSSKRKKAENYYKSLFEEEAVNLNKVARRARYLSKQIRDVIEPVTIRRNRLDLRNNPLYKNEVEKFSKVADPIEWFFELSSEQSEFYSRIIEHYFGDPEGGRRFKGAIYRPFEYEIDVEKDIGEGNNRQLQQQRNLFDFMRRLLVKRFESSFGSFKQSIKNFKKITESCKKFIDKTGEYILDRALLEKIYELDLEEIEERLLDYEEKINRDEYPKNHKRYKLKNFKRRDEFISDLESDLDLFDEILKMLSTLDLVQSDPKMSCLIQNIKRELKKKPKAGEPKRKIIIFSEYVDTVRYLSKAIKEEFGSRTLVVDGPLFNSGIKQINENFDASYPKQKEDYDILLSSDKISEGFNLNRAGMVINYDIPWNPVRVIQRLGRINRISKRVFDELFIINFFPTERGAKHVRSREIATDKMLLIHAALGEDSKIFDIDEEPSPSGLFNRIQQNPDSREEESFYTKALRRFLKIKDNHPELIKNLDGYPPRIKVAKKHSENELLVFFKKVRLYVTAASTDVENLKPYYMDFEDAFDKIVCTNDEEGIDWNTDQFWRAYQRIKEFKDYSSRSNSEQSLEQKALNNLDFLARSDKEELMPLKDFLRTLRDDIAYYGTLSDYTMRRIANFKENSSEDVKKLMDELGKDYLLREKSREKAQKREVIIAIENKKA